MSASSTSSIGGLIVSTNATNHSLPTATLAEDESEHERYIACIVFIVPIIMICLRVWWKHHKRTLQMRALGNNIHEGSSLLNGDARIRTSENRGREEEEEITGSSIDRDNILQLLCKKHSDKKIKCAYFGKSMRDTNTFKAGDEVIVLIIDADSPIDEQTYQHPLKTFYIECKLWKYPPLEGAKMSSNEHKYLIEEKTLVKIEKCLRDYSSNLFANHSNLQIISASGFRSRQGEIVENSGPCIVLYTSCKGVLPDKEKEFPKAIDGINTDVREGFFYLFANEEGVFDPLKMGASIGRKDYVYHEGTLGGFVKDTDRPNAKHWLGPQAQGFITCAHVLFDISKDIHPSFSTEVFSVVQPCSGVAEENSNNVCGDHIKPVFPLEDHNGVTIDASLVRISARFPREALFTDLSRLSLNIAGFSKEKPPTYSTGAYRDYRDNKEYDERNNPCIKVGARTGLTKGKLEVREISAKFYTGPVVKTDYVYQGQLEIKGPADMVFSQRGDSGSLVFQVDPTKENGKHTLFCIGMIVGGTSYHSTVATPIVAVLDKLDVELIKFS